jgi:Mn2+/Fe2+ NRAMP family transporter
MSATYRLTLALLAIGVVFAIVSRGAKSCWASCGRVALTAQILTVIVAVFGTTIPTCSSAGGAGSGGNQRRPGGIRADRAPEDARRHLRRIKIDTYIGMGFSNLIALFIIISTAATLHAAGITDIQTSAEAAEALRPLAGDSAFLLFSLGIIGTGLLAVPVLAGSAAYAVAEAFEWKSGLDLKLLEAREFYGMIAFATLGGVAIDFTPIDPIKALFWSAVINGVIGADHGRDDAARGRPRVMGDFVVTRRLKALGWLATWTMAAAVVACW